MFGFLVFIGLLVAVAFFVVGLYNTLVRLRNASENAFSDIDVQLKRRHDLIPNLVSTVKGYASHERQTLEDVVAARSRAVDNDNAPPGERAAAEGLLSQALGRLFALAEAYPDLKANQNFLSLQGELSTIEEAIQNARRYYNAVVRDLNTKCETFPSVLVANMFGFVKKEYFELDAATERQAPQVDFGS
jgi:LemA protein